MKHLIIGDAHAQPDVANDRFDWLGELIAEEKPDVVVDIGDMASVDSLCSYDKGTKSFEGRRLADDFEVTRDARARINAPIDKLNSTFYRKHKKKKYSPRLVGIVGNHEARVDKMLEHNPEWIGMYSVDDFGYSAYGWEMQPFLSILNVDGINYCHYFTSGVMGRAISGVNAGRKIVQRLHASGTQGHSHFYEHHTEVTVDGQRLHGCMAGCYFDHHMGYAGQSNAEFRTGILIKDNVDGVGDYDERWVSIEEIKRRYS